MGLVNIIMLAVIIEGLIEYAKLIIRHDMVWKQVAAIVGSVFLAVAAKVDLFAVFELEFAVPYLGTVLTGIFLSRGANYVSDFIKKLQAPSEGSA